VFSSPIDAKRFPQVALDSSMAKIPRPGEAIVFCIHTQANKNNTQEIITVKHQILHQQCKNIIQLL
jgi:hypothetical protein